MALISICHWVGLAWNLPPPESSWLWNHCHGCHCSQGTVMVATQLLRPALQSARVASFMSDAIEVCGLCATTPTNPPNPYYASYPLLWNLKSRFPNFLALRERGMFRFLPRQVGNRSLWLVLVAVWREAAVANLRWKVPWTCCPPPWAPCALHWCNPHQVAAIDGLPVHSASRAQMYRTDQDGVRSPTAGGRWIISVAKVPIKIIKKNL